MTTDDLKAFVHKSISRSLRYYFRPGNGTFTRIAVSLIARFAPSTAFSFVLGLSISVSTCNLISLCNIGLMYFLISFRNVLRNTASVTSCGLLSRENGFAPMRPLTRIFFSPTCLLLFSADKTATLRYSVFPFHLIYLVGWEFFADGRNCSSDARVPSPTYHCVVAACPLQGRRLLLRGFFSFFLSLLLVSYCFRSQVSFTKTDYLIIALIRVCALVNVNRHQSDYKKGDSGNSLRGGLLFKLKRTVTSSEALPIVRRVP